MGRTGSIHKPVKVNPDNMKKYIQQLKDLQTECERERNKNIIVDLGDAADALKIVEKNYAAMTNAFGMLVDATRRLMENTIDGFVDIDDTYVNVFNSVNKERINIESVTWNR